MLPFLMCPSVRAGPCGACGTSGGVQPGVARSLGRLVVLSEGRAPSHADTAELRPCHPRPGSPVELDERYRRDQKRCLKLLAVKHEVVRRLVHDGGGPHSLPLEQYVRRRGGGNGLAHEAALGEHEGAVPPPRVSLLTRDAPRGGAARGIRACR